MRLIILPCFYPSSDGAILISLHLHSPIITCERNHQSPAGSRPSPPPPSRLQGSVSYILWTIIHTEPIKYFSLFKFRNIYFINLERFSSPKRAARPSAEQAGLFLKQSERLLVFCSSASHRLDEPGDPRRLLLNAASRSQRGSSFGTAARRLELAYFNTPSATTTQKEETTVWKSVHFLSRQEVGGATVSCTAK